MEERCTIKRVFRYDNLDRLVSVTTEAGQELNYIYDSLGNRTSAPTKESKMSRASAPPGESKITTTAAEDPQALVLERKYSLLKTQLDTNQISSEEFVERVNRELRFEDSRGRWRQLRALDGKWLVWDGEKWVEQN